MQFFSAVLHKISLYLKRSLRTRLLPFVSCFTAENLRRVAAFISLFLGKAVNLESNLFGFAMKSQAIEN